MEARLVRCAQGRGLVRDVWETVERMSIDRYIGSRLKLLRLAVDVNPEKVAAYMSVSLERYSEFELGIRDIPAGNLFDLCCFFDVPVTHFFDGYEQFDRNQGEFDEHTA